MAVNATEALRWYHKAAKAGHPDGAYRAGVLYLRGAEGVRRSVTKAASRFSDAAQEGHSLAKFWIGKVRAHAAMHGCAHMHTHLHTSMHA